MMLVRFQLALTLGQVQGNMVANSLSLLARATSPTHHAGGDHEFPAPLLFERGLRLTSTGRV